MGSIIWVKGVEWFGVISLPEGYWLAYKESDPSMAIHLVQEDAPTE